MYNNSKILIEQNSRNFIRVHETFYILIIIMAYIERSEISKAIKTSSLVSKAVFRFTLEAELIRVKLCRHEDTLRSSYLSETLCGDFFSKIIARVFALSSRAPFAKTRAKGLRASSRFVDFDDSAPPTKGLSCQTRCKHRGYSHYRATTRSRCFRNWFSTFFVLFTFSSFFYRLIFFYYFVYLSFTHSLWLYSIISYRSFNNSSFSHNFRIFPYICMRTIIAFILEFFARKSYCLLFYSWYIYVIFLNVIFPKGTAIAYVTSLWEKPWSWRNMSA